MKHLLCEHSFFLRAGIRDGRKRVKLAIAAFDAQAGNDFMTACERFTEKKIRVASRVWQGLTNPEISKLMGTTEAVIKHQLQSTFDKLGVWSWRWMGPPNPRISRSNGGQPVRTDFPARCFKSLQPPCDGTTAAKDLRETSILHVRPRITH